MLQPAMFCTMWSPRYKKMSSGNSIALSALSSERFYNPHQTVASPAPLLFVPDVATSVPMFTCTLTTKCSLGKHPVILGQGKGGRGRLRAKLRMRIKDPKDLILGPCN